MRRKRFVIACIVAAVFIGAAAGVGSYTFIYAKGFSYLSNDPQACANCHIMQDHYDAWSRSSHHAVAVCNDCHTPHDLVGKYTAKGINGFNHSLAFTTGWYPEKIIITDFNRNITEQACRDCHGQVVMAIEHTVAEGPTIEKDEQISCLRCHDDVGHLE
ncbi:MAG: cytochrome c nitrite reductase small subunit [Candidatus Sumerlaeota bacterium]